MAGAIKPSRRLAAWTTVVIGGAALIAWRATRPVDVEVVST
jgi:hypothetical protein